MAAWPGRDYPGHYDGPSPSSPPYSIDRPRFRLDLLQWNFLAEDYLMITSENIVRTSTATFGKGEAGDGRELGTGESTRLQAILGTSSLGRAKKRTAGSGHIACIAFSALLLHSDQVFVIQVVWGSNCSFTIGNLTLGPGPVVQDRPVRAACRSGEEEKQASWRGKGLDHFPTAAKSRAV